MGNGNFVGQRARINSTVPLDLPVWRRDGRDIKAMKNILEQQVKRLTLDYPQISEDKLVECMQIYSDGVWDAYRGMVELILEEQIPYNERISANPDHWFEVDLANAVLFTNLNLKGIEELLPGRLFTTRMPQNLHIDTESAELFKQKVDKKHLHTVLILTEKEEYEKYAGADLEAFYRSQGLNVISRPIKDFTIPNPDELMLDIKDVTWLLSEGHNVLIHCAGGSGRTGLVVAGIVRNVGVRDPITWIRRIKSVYVETQAQEEFITHLPIILDERMTQRHPRLLDAMILEQLLDMTSSQMMVVPDLDIAFDRLDRNHTGVLSIPIIKEMIQELGDATVNIDTVLMNKIALMQPGEITKSEFVKMMHFTMKKTLSTSSASSVSVHRLGPPSPPTEVV